MTSFLIACLLSCCLQTPLEAPTSDRVLLNVWAFSGLRLRDAPNGKIMLTIPYGHTVEVVCIEMEQPMMADSIDGHWVKVNYKGQEGWVFDGYLSWLPPPSNDCVRLWDYARRYFTASSTKISTYSGVICDSDVDTEFEQIFEYKGHLIGYHGSEGLSGSVNCLAIQGATERECRLLLGALLRTQYQNPLKELSGRIHLRAREGYQQVCLDEPPQ